MSWSCLPTTPFKALNENDVVDTVHMAWVLFCQHRTSCWWWLVGIWFNAVDFHTHRHICLCSYSKLFLQTDGRQLQSVCMYIQSWRVKSECFKHAFQWRKNPTHDKKPFVSRSWDPGLLENGCQHAEFTAFYYSISYYRLYSYKNNCVWMENLLCLPFVSSSIEFITWSM